MTYPTTDGTGLNVVHVINSSFAVDTAGETSNKKASEIVISILSIASKQDGVINFNIYNDFLLISFYM